MSMSEHNNQQQNLPEIIVLAGSPGNGKSTVCNALRDDLDIPLIELGLLRQFHLDREWKKSTPEEEAMSFENLVAITWNSAAWL